MSNRNSKKEMRLQITSASSIEIHVFVSRIRHQEAESHMDEVLDADSANTDDKQLLEYGERKWVSPTCMVL